MKNSKSAIRNLKSRQALFAFLIFTFTFALNINAQVVSGGQFTLDQSVIASGGSTSSSGIFKVEGTSGQSVAGTTSTGATFELGSGFWGNGSAAALAGVTISGHIVTPYGPGLRNATVSLIDSQNVRRTTTTSSFGFYSFDNVRTGDVYTIIVSSRRYRYAPQILPINGSLINLDFVGLE